MKAKTVEKSTGRSDRAAIDPSMHDLYKQLSEGADPVEAPFGELKEVFLMAAALGYAKGKKRPLASGRREIVRWETFSRDRDVPFLYSLAIAETGDVKILEEGFEFLTIAEEYANEGIHIMSDRTLNQRGKPLWNLVDLVRKEIGTK